MSLKPITPKHYSSNDVDPGSGVSIKNEARAMNRYGSRHAAGYTAPAQAGGMRSYDNRARYSRPKKNVPMLVAVVLLAAALVVGGAVAVIGWLGSSNSPVNANQEVTLTIPAGYGAGDIAQLLRANDVIDSTTELIQTIAHQGAGNALKAGTYTFQTGMTSNEVVAALIRGPEANGVPVTIPEGLTVAQTMERIASAIHVSYDELIAQAKASNYVADYTFLYGVYNDSLEGFLFPETYFFDENASADTVIRTMLDQFVAATQLVDWTKATQGNTTLSLYQVMVLASLVERETAVATERPIVASVIYNRLNAGMMLQIDAAINYALNKWDLLTYADLEVDSPYNLYKYYGLCPGPICSPSLASIQAAVSPDATTYYYYVAAPQLDGSHTFCSTLDEFNVAKSAYNQAIGVA